MKAVIVGGGIGGLTTALFLERIGIDAEIIERADRIRELGVGINLLPHAVKELAWLGLLPELQAHGIATRELIYTNRFGQLVWREMRGLDAGHAFPQISIHRGKLLRIIHDAVIARLGPNAVRTGFQVDRFEQSESGVTAHLSERDGTRSRVSGDLLVGADGIHSTIRAQLFPGEGSPIWNGLMIWRGCTPWPAWSDGRTMAIAGGNFAKFVYYPIEAFPERPNMRLTNWAVMATTGLAGTPPMRREDWSRRGIVSDVIPFVRDRFRLNFVDPAAIIEATEEIYEYPNCDRDPLPHWSFGRVTLLGDAAHPMYPVGSNGASQAIIDAQSLSTYLALAGTVETALGAYDDERRPATSKIILSNRRGGPEGVIDMVEGRAPDGFDEIESVATHEERQSVVKGYARIAGFARH